MPGSKKAKSSTPLRICRMTASLSAPGSRYVKGSRRTRKQADEIPLPSSANSPLYRLPDELLLCIFSNLLEQDLCRVSQVCRRFYNVANDKQLWANLYKDIFEYDLVVQRYERQFEFFSPDDISGCANPWKISMSRLYHGVHVRPGYEDKTFAGRSVTYFNTVQKALEYVRVTAHQNAVVFLHAGTHRVKSLVVNCEVALIGAAPGTVAEFVVVETSCLWPIIFNSSSRRSYLGHVTLRFTPDESSLLWAGRFRLEMVNGTSPMLDHCLIYSTVDEHLQGNMEMSQFIPDRNFVMLLAPLEVDLLMERRLNDIQISHCVLTDRNAANFCLTSTGGLLHVCIGYNFNPKKPLPPTCPWYKMGLDVGKQAGCRCVNRCLLPEDREELWNYELYWSVFHH